MSAERERADPLEPPSGRVARAWGWLLATLSPLVVAGTIAGAALSAAYLPSIENQPGAPMKALLPENPKAALAEQHAYGLFHLVFETPWVVVQRNPSGLSRSALRHTAALALATSRQRNPAFPSILAAAPITNTRGIFPGSREDGTTAITYLFMAQNTSLGDGVREGNRYADLLRRDGGFVGLTGPFAARQSQYGIIQAHLHLVELATVLVVMLIVGLAFRSLGAPLVTVVTAGLAFTVAEHVLGWVAEHAHLSMPSDLTPVAVALMLGIVTDYSVFFLAGTRDRLAAGESRLRAVAGATATVTPIVLVAGLLVACGLATLTAGTLGFFRSFGPGMSIVVACGLVLSLLFVPACLAVFGRLVFWPGLRLRERRLRVHVPWPTRVLTTRPGALVVVLAAALALVAAGSGLAHTGLGIALVRALPSHDPVRESAAEAAKGFAPGVLAPTEVIVRAPGITARRAALARLQAELRRQPHVAGVLGPAQENAVAAFAGERRVARARRALAPRGRPLGIFLAPNGDGARYVVVFGADPTDAPAIGALRALEGRAPALLRQSGLAGASAEFAGQTALGVDAVGSVRTSMWRIGIAALGVNLVFLVLFLRALVAPLYLVAASALALAATFGLTTYVFQGLLGYGGLDYFLPVVIGVLLVSLGSDYNLFVVGRIWQETGRRPLREAVRTAAPRAGRTISVAGIAMALSFAVLAVVPLGFFRMLAFAMSVGILLDAVVARSLLVPGLIVLVGKAGFWPRRPPQPAEPEGEPVAPDAEPVEAPARGG